jgi:hypothetical protein
LLALAEQQQAGRRIIFFLLRPVAVRSAAIAIRAQNSYSMQIPELAISTRSNVMNAKRDDKK